MITTREAKPSSALCATTVSNEIDVVGADNLTPLTRAINQGDQDAVLHLLEQKADVNKKDKVYGESTPLILASFKGYHEIVKLLCEHKANLRMSNDVGYFPLSAAARDNRVAVIKTLLDSKAEVNQADHHGCTALSFAAAEGHAESVKCLLENGADMSQPNKYRSMPSKAAKNQEIVSLMQEHQQQIKILFSCGLFDKKPKEKTALQLFAKNEIFESNLVKMMFTYVYK